MNRTIYIHDIPGRLRVRTEAIKKDACRAAAVQDLLTATPGVVSAEANLLTGSITVTYETTRLTSVEILTALRENGYVDGGGNASASTGEPAQASLALSLLKDVAVPKVGRMLLGLAVEHAVTAAFAALL